jgi:dTDP-4-amino-4,6-dideoxygalactose transaminase
MKFVDLNSEYEFFKTDIENNRKDVLNSGWYLLGPQLEKLETDFAKVIGVNNAVGVKNCTDAITMIVSIFPKDVPVIIPNFGAYPTAIAVARHTSNIYYINVDNTLTMDPRELPKDVKNGIIIPVHLFGNNCDMDAILKYAKDNSHTVIEDCAQSTGSGSGTKGDYSVFSFYPTKPLSSMGDGGMICSNKDLEIFKKMRFYGQNNGTIEFVGINSRMDEFQASIVNVKLNKFQELNDIRISIANRYKKIVKGVKERGRCVYHQFVMLVNDRNKVIEILQNNKIPYMIHYPKHISTMVHTSRLDSPEVENIVNDKVISLPCHPFLLESDINKIEEVLWEIKPFEY